MKHFFQIASILYVCSALFVFTQPLATSKAASQGDVNQRRLMEPTKQTVLNHQRLYNADQDERANYTIEVWTASWCGPCRRYKATQVPALLKAGFTVKVLDYDKDNPPKDVKKVPTVRLYYKGTFIHQETYWKANSLTKYVDNHLSLKD